MDESAALKSFCESQDPKAFEWLVEQYRREAFYHALAFMGNEHDAADACQEAFSRAYAGLPKLGAVDQFYPWFYRVLKNLCLNILERRKTAARYQRGDGRVVAARRGSVDPAVLLERDEARAQVWEALGELPAKHREILVLRHFLGLSYGDMAERLSIPRGTVMSRLYHARKAFQGSFSGAEGKELGS